MTAALVVAAEVLPGWAVLSVAAPDGPKDFAGWIEEADHGGIVFFEVHYPRGTVRRLVNPAQVREITPCSESTAGVVCPSNWRRP